MYYFTLNEDGTELDFQHIPHNNNNNVILKAKAERKILTHPYLYPPFEKNLKKNVASCKDHTVRFD